MHLKSLNSHETLRAKEEFEFACRDHGVIPENYRADQHSSFKSAAFRDHLSKFEQTIRFAGTGGHHSNGMAEKAIQDIMASARTMMLHAAILWPDVADAQLWPMAVDHAVFIHNHLPRQDNGLSPADLFTKQRWPHAKFHDLHVFGCPVYVLDKRIADGKKIPRWQPRSTRQVNLGFSNQFASTVPLLLNPNTGAITSQYHVVFDDWFTTVTSTNDDLPAFNSPEWSQLFGDSVFQFPTDADSLDDPPPEPPTPSRATPLMDTYDVASSTHVPTPPVPAPPVPVPAAELERERSVTRRPIEPVPWSVQQREQHPQSRQQREHRPPVQAQQRERVVTFADDPPTELPAPSPVTPPTPPPLERPAPVVSPSRPAPKRSPRPRALRELEDYNRAGAEEHNPLRTGRTRAEQRRQRQLLTNQLGSYLDKPLDEAVEEDAQEFLVLMQSVDLPEWDEATSTFKEPENLNSNPFSDGWSLDPSSIYYQEFDDLPGGYYDVPSCWLGYKPSETPKLMLHRSPEIEEVVFASARKSKSDPDTLTWDQAMAESPDQVKKWLEAAQTEISALEHKRTWKETLISEATTKVIPGTWVFRRKRNPSGEITKYKARWVLRGDLQEVNFEDTWAPVVNWTTVRIFLALSLLLGWVTKALDFTNAFLHAELPKSEVVYTFLPRGFRSMMETRNGPKACLRMKKSIYGLRVAPKLWYLHLLQGLEKLGFKKSSYDQCLLFTKDALLVTFVDDCGLAVRDPKLIKHFVTELRKMGFELEVEGDFSAFLGVAIERRDDGAIHMHQKGLIQKVLEATGMVDCNPNWTPASQAALGSDPDGPLWPNTPWKYSSIVGMLLYLSTNTRPDITFAVSQVGRFNKEPRVSHAKAVKMIIRYLKRTSDKGIIIRFSGKLELVCYADADFAGLFGREVPRNPDSARSRGGYIIILGGIPVFWKSFLMSAICLSTLEAEYQCLSKAMTQVIAFKLLIEELVPVFDLDVPDVGIVASVFEDNQGALCLATNQRITTRTKYFHVKWHHFWSHVTKNDGKDGKIRLYKIDTHNQRSDYFTKGLVREPFENNRFANQGW